MKIKKVYVVGLTGQSVFFTTEHLPSSGETIHCKKLFSEIGGKGHNQAVACARNGVNTIFFGAVGSDVSGELCQNALINEHIETHLLLKDTATAYAAITTTSAGDNFVQVYKGASAKITPNDIEQFLVGEISENDFLLLQNELPFEVLQKTITIADAAHCHIVLNPAPMTAEIKQLVQKCFLITPNYGEMLSLIGLEPQNKYDDQFIANEIRKLGIINCIVTIGGEGCLYISNNKCIRFDSYKVDHVVDTTGAGDTFNGYLVSELVNGVDIEDAIGTANVAAGLSVTKKGVMNSIPYRHEVIRSRNRG